MCGLRAQENDVLHEQVETVSPPAEEVGKTADSFYSVAI